MVLYKKIIFLFSFLFLSLLLSAQDNSPLHHLHLTDGSYLKGYVSESQVEFIKFKLISGEILTIERKSISSLEASKKELKVFRNGSTIHTGSQYNILSVGIMASENKWSGLNIGYSMPHYIHGWRINQYVNVGLGTGIDSYNQEFIPIYLDFRGYLTQNTWSPYYSLNAGYAFSVDLLNRFNNEFTKLKGGFLIHPAIGVELATRKNFNWLFEMGVKIQQGEIQYKEQDYFDDWTYRRMTFKVGVIF